MHTASRLTRFVRRECVFSSPMVQNGACTVFSQLALESASKILDINWQTPFVPQISLLELAIATR